MQPLAILEGSWSLLMIAGIVGWSALMLFLVYL